MTKQFSLGDVLSITTGWLLSPKGAGGIYDILNHMTDSDLNTLALARAAEVCGPKLLEQFPQFASSDFQAAFEEFEHSIEPIADSKKEAFARKWLATQIDKYGDVFDVEALPAGTFEQKHPVEEFIDKSGNPNKVIGLNMPTTH